MAAGKAASAVEHRRARVRESVDLTVVVPTRNERENIEELTRRVRRSLEGHDYEIVVVDDSDDDTPELVRAMADRDDTVRLLHRGPEQRVDGLGGAVAAGLDAARGSVSVIIDADLQHPPELIPKLVDPVLMGAADIAVASRYCPGGSVEGLDGLGRRFASRLARDVVHVLFPKTRAFTDPCGGFFAIRSDLVQGTDLRPRGYKILLELLVRTRWEHPVEVPYRFAERANGTSKFGHAEVRRFGQHLITLKRARPASGSAGLDERAEADEQAPAWAVPALLGLFLLLQAFFILGGQLRGAFLDEGIYITAGWRTLEGHGLVDGYLTWFAGHLLWPVMAAVAHLLGGLEGARLLAAACITVAIAASGAAARELFGRRAQLWTLGLLVSSAPLLALAHLAVYDTVAAALITSSLAFAARYARSPQPGLVTAAAVCAAMAVLAKYPVVAFVPFVLAVLFWSGKLTRVRALGFGAVFGAIALMAFLPAREQLALFVSWRVQNNPGFGVTRPMILVEAVMLILPLALVVGAGVVAARSRTTTALAASVLLFPTYHLLIGNSVGLSKHVCYGLLFAAPVAGSWLARRDGRPTAEVRNAIGIAVVAGSLLGASYLVRPLGSGWLDASDVASFLKEHVEPEDRLLMSNSWPILPSLYNDGPLDSTDQVWDAYELRNHPSPPGLCTFDWVVDEEGAIGWDDDTRRQLEACGVYRQVMRTDGEITSLGRDLRYVTWEASIVVWERVEGGER